MRATHFFALLYAAALCGSLPASAALAAPATAPATRPAGPVEPRFGPPPSMRIVFILDTVRTGENAGPSATFGELKKAVNLLKEPQAFALVINATGKPAVFGGADLLPATKENKEHADTFVAGLRPPAKPVSPLAAIRSGMDRSKLELVYLLADHEWTDRDAVVKAVAELAKKQPKLKINTIYFQEHGQPAVSEEMQKALETIARDHNGFFSSVSEENLDESPKDAPAKPPAAK